ncbi:hypothetical protein, partial [Methylobacterium sp. E-046]|uniref:hypothetical protein n=1 Tax=Methylobacterium sp. E-046 TaxID=2836576 RepID=UPI001FB971CC
SLTVMQRLLDRRTADGALVPADPALIQATIEAGYDEVRRIRLLLAEIAIEPTSPWHRMADNMAAAVADLDVSLKTFEQMLSHMSG